MVVAVATQKNGAVDVIKQVTSIEEKPAYWVVKTNEHLDIRVLAKSKFEQVISSNI